MWALIRKTGMPLPGRRSLSEFSLILAILLASCAPASAPTSQATMEAAVAATVTARLGQTTTAPASGTVGAASTAPVATLAVSQTTPMASTAAPATATAVAKPAGGPRGGAPWQLLADAGFVPTLRPPWSTTVLTARFAADRQGDLFIADGYVHGIDIYKLSPAGQLVGKWTTRDEPPPASLSANDLLRAGIAIDGQGNVYVAGGKRNRVEKLLPSGQSVPNWGGEQGRSDAQYPYVPRAVAVDESGNNVYVADSTNHRILRFSADGRRTATWGGVKGTQPGQFYYPSYVAVDRSGNVYVAEGRFAVEGVTPDRVLKLSPDGRFVMQISPKLEFPGFLPGPLAADSSGSIYVVEDRGLSKFSNTGSQIDLWAEIDGKKVGDYWGILDVAVDGQDNAYILAYDYETDKAQVRKLGR